MKILLVGEFSGLHRELKKGLIELGHEVTVMSAGDGWKEVECDIRIPSGISLKSKIKALVSQFRLIWSIKGYDIVQFIYPHIFNRLVNAYFIDCLIKQNKNAFLIAAGSDAFYWKDYKKKFRYSPHNDNNIIDNNNKKIPKWLENWNNKIILKVNAIIPVSYDYRVGYVGIKNLAPTIPLPILVKDFKPYFYKENKNKIKILYGVSRPGFKGSRYIEPALELLIKKYPEEVEVIKIIRVPFTVYIDLVADVDIVVDQALSYSYGMNALLCASMGKVTLSGAEPECLTEFNVTESPIINILPSINDIFNKLEILIKNRNLIAILSKESRFYVEKVHDAKIVAKQYISTWNKFNIK